MPEILARRKRLRKRLLLAMEAVAAAAGVSTSTVSHVINKTRKVHPDTERAVLDAIERVGYSPNHLARALAGAPTQTVGVAISALSSHYFGEMVHAIEAECANCGLMMLLADTHEDPDYEVKVVQALHERRVDGILIAPAASSTSGALAYLRERSVPTVLVDRFVGTTFDQIAVESRDAARSLVSHLVGYRLALEAARIRFDGQGSAPAHQADRESERASAIDSARPDASLSQFHRGCETALPLSGLLVRFITDGVADWPRPVWRGELSAACRPNS